MPSPLPGHGPVAACDQLDRRAISAVLGHRVVMGAIQADDLGQHVCINPICVISRTTPSRVTDVTCSAVVNADPAAPT